MLAATSTVGGSDKNATPRAGTDALIPCVTPPRASSETACVWTSTSCSRGSRQRRCHEEARQACRAEHGSLVDSNEQLADSASAILTIVADCAIAEHVVLDVGHAHCSVVIWEGGAMRKHHIQQRNDDVAGAHRNDENADKRIGRALRTLLGQQLGTERARCKVRVGQGIVTLRGELPSALDFAMVADLVRSIPHVKRLDARLKVM
jgi:hypothetical protein